MHSCAPSLAGAKDHQWQWYSTSTRFSIHFVIGCFHTTRRRLFSKPVSAARKGYSRFNLSRASILLLQANWMMLNDDGDASTNAIAPQRPSISKYISPRTRSCRVVSCVSGKWNICARYATAPYWARIKHVLSYTKLNWQFERMQWLSDFLSRHQTNAITSIIIIVFETRTSSVHRLRSHTVSNVYSNPRSYEILKKN